MIQFVDKLMPGSVLAEDVIDLNGRCLLNKGTTIIEKHIRILKIWGVTEVRVDNSFEKKRETTALSGGDPDLLQDIITFVRRRFCHNDLSFSPAKELFKLSVAELILKLQNGDERLLSKRKGPNEPFNIYDQRPKISNTSHVKDLVFQKIEELPILPSIYNKLNAKLNDPRSSFKDFADIIGTDPVLSAKVLKLANSAYFGFKHAIETITDATIAIGTEAISTLVIGLSIVSHFKNVAQDLIDMESFWKHSIACGVAARVISKYTSVKNAERLFVSGLIHDIGRLILWHNFSSEQHEIYRIAEQTNRFLVDVEDEVLGINHAVIGQLLMQKWKIPSSIEMVVSNHHTPLLSQNPLESSIIYLSDIIVSAVGFGTSGENLIQKITPEIWSCLQLTDSIFKPAVKQIKRQVFEITSYII